MYEIYKSNNNEIWNQLEDWVVDYSDSELVMTISSKGYAKPLNTTRDGHVKLERPDEVSGDIPFTTTVHNESIATWKFVCKTHSFTWFFLNRKLDVSTKLVIVTLKCQKLCSKSSLHGIDYHTNLMLHTTDVLFMFYYMHWLKERSWAKMMLPLMWLISLRVKWKFVFSFSQYIFLYEFSCIYFHFIVLLERRCDDQKRVDALNDYISEICSNQKFAGSQN